MKVMFFARAGTRCGFMHSRMYGKMATACGSMLRMPADNFTITHRAVANERGEVGSKVAVRTYLLEEHHLVDLLHGRTGGLFQRVHDLVHQRGHTGHGGQLLPQNVARDGDGVQRSPHLMRYVPDDGPFGLQGCSALIGLVLRQLQVQLRDICRRVQGQYALRRVGGAEDVRRTEEPEALPHGGK